MKATFLCRVSLLWIMATTISAIGFAQEAGDEADIQAKINVLGEEGGVVTLDAGTYTINKPVELPNFVTLKGAGRDKTILVLADGVNDAPVRNVIFDRGALLGSHHVTITDLTVDGNAEGNPENRRGGVWLEYTHDYRVENVRIKNARGISGLFTNPDHKSSGTVRKNYILNCVVEGTQGGRTYGAHPGNGMWVTGATNNENVLIRGNVVRRNLRSGIFVEDDLTNIFIEDNDVYENGSHGVWLAGVRSISVANNRIHHNGRGIEIAWNCSRILVQSNEIYDNQLEAISLATLGEDDEYPTYCVIVGNTIRNNNQLGLDALPAIRIEHQFNTIAFNHIIDDQEVPTQYFGVGLLAPNNVAINNYIEGSFGEDYWVKGENNEIVRWDKEKPWKPDNLVSWYGKAEIE